MISYDKLASRICGCVVALVMVGHTFQYVNRCEVHEHCEPEKHIEVAVYYGAPLEDLRVAVSSGVGYGSRAYNLTPGAYSISILDLWL